MQTSTAMKVFISHSGERSRALAQELQKLVRKLVPSADPWVSTGIEKGSRWIPEIAENLEAATLGIVCITSDNLLAPWLLFEAGALSKRLDGRVGTFLLDVEPSAVQAPLSQFQHTSATKDDVLTLIENINTRVQEANEQPRYIEDLREQFEALWPNLQSRVLELRAQAGDRAPTRTSEDMIKEVLETVRGLARDLAQPKPLSDYNPFDDTASAPWVPLTISVGDLVNHLQFGRGRVQKIEKVGETGDFRVKVKFDTAGTKVLRWGYAALEKLNTAD